MGLLLQPLNVSQQNWSRLRIEWRIVAVAFLSTWAFWPTLNSLVSVWRNNPQYSHGFLVAPFAGWLLWHRREQCPPNLTPSPWLGGALLIASVMLRVLAGWRFAEWPEAISLIPFLFSVALIFGGTALTKWSAPAIAFLAFMIPLPHRVEVALGSPLQSLATVTSTFVLQTLGQPAIAQGHTILLRDVRLEVVEACSGLKMLVTFLTFATAVCLVVTKPVSDKLVILASSIPIAIAVNVIRIVFTGWMCLHVSSEAAKVFYHDLAGWLMMPLALCMLGIELWIMQRLIVEQPMRLAAR